MKSVTARSGPGPRPHGVRMSLRTESPLFRVLSSVRSLSLVLSFPLSFSHALIPPQHPLSHHLSTVLSLSLSLANTLNSPSSISVCMSGLRNKKTKKEKERKQDLSSPLSFLLLLFLSFSSSSMSLLWIVVAAMGELFLKTGKIKCSFYIVWVDFN